MLTHGEYCVFFRAPKTLNPDKTEYKRKKKNLEWFMNIYTTCNRKNRKITLSPMHTMDPKR